MTSNPLTLRKGDVHEAVVMENLTRTQIVQYAGASGDFNPLHTDEIYSTQVAGNRTVMAHGMLVMGMTGTAVTDLVGADRLLAFGGRFVAPTWPGDTLTVTVTVTEVVDEPDGTRAQLDLRTSNQKGEAVFTGVATARLATKETA